MAIIFSLLAGFMFIAGISANAQEVQNSCKKDKEFAEKAKSSPECAGKEFRCMDGWNRITYIDGRLFTKEIKSSVGGRLDTMYKTEELKELNNATIATQNYSNCSCVHPVGYFIKQGEKTKEVTCGEFYRFIEDYNSKCNDCVKRVEDGCC